jgi:hypothetical protein
VAFAIKRSCLNPFNQICCLCITHNIDRNGKAIKMGAGATVNFDGIKFSPREILQVSKNVISADVGWDLDDDRVMIAIEGVSTTTNRISNRAKFSRAGIKLALLGSIIRGASCRFAIVFRFRYRIIIGPPSILVSMMAMAAWLSTTPHAFSRSFPRFL